MSVERIAHKGYGMLERNRVNPDNMESQCVLDAATFADGAEVGMIVNVNKAANKITLSGGIKGLLVNSERIFNQFKQGLKEYHVGAGEMASVLFLDEGNTFTTNTVSYTKDASAGYADEAAFWDAVEACGTTALYGKQHTDGSILITSVATDPLQVVKKTTMPDGQKAVKFIVNKASL